MEHSSRTMARVKFFSLLAVVVVIGLLHFFTPGHQAFFHDTYRRLSYFPIVLGSIWFGVRGGLFLAVMSSIFFIPHLLLYIGAAPDTYLSELTEILLYLAAGTVTGLIVNREARLRERYRRLSEKLKASYRRLHRETGLLLEAEEQLSASQKLSALGQLSASLAHEIKNPLSSIKGTAEILLDDFPEGHPKREFAQILVKEVHRLNATVDEVLQFSRGRSLGPAEEKEPLARCLEQVARLVGGHLRKKAARMTIDDPGIGATFGVESGKMSQVFLNLILNAIDAVPKKGGLIRIVLTDLEGEGIRVAVIDNGPGVSPEIRDRIFIPFVTGKEDGIGLGLSISRKIVESYGGRLELEENAGNGACFVVYLPCGTPDLESLVKSHGMAK